MCRFGKMYFEIDVHIFIEKITEDTFFFAYRNNAKYN